MIAGLFEFAHRIGVLAYLSIYGLVVRIEVGDSPRLSPPHLVATEALRMLTGAPHRFWVEDLAS